MITPTKQSTISFNVNIKLKKKLQSIADNYGLTISDLMRISATQLTSQGITIEPELEPNDTLAKQTKAAVADYENSTTTTVDSVEALDKYFLEARS